MLNDYTVCGQYPGAVEAGATVSLKCTNADLPLARYVIVQFPIVDHMNFCELDVCARGSFDRSRSMFAVTGFFICGGAMHFPGF